MSFLKNLANMEPLFLAIIIVKMINVKYLRHSLTESSSATMNVGCYDYLLQSQGGENMLYSAVNKFLMEISLLMIDEISPFSLFFYFFNNKQDEECWNCNCSNYYN